MLLNRSLIKSNTVFYDAVDDMLVSARDGDFVLWRQLSLEAIAFYRRNFGAAFTLLWMCIDDSWRLIRIPGNDQGVINSLQTNLIASLEFPIDTWHTFTVIDDKTLFEMLDEDVLVDIDVQISGLILVLDSYFGEGFLEQFTGCKQISLKQGRFFSGFWEEEKVSTGTDRS